MGAELTEEVLAVCQSKEVSISSEKRLFPWLCGVLERHPHRGRKNRGC